MNKKVLAWWSGGVTSAVACYLALMLFDEVDIVFIGTGNEDEDTYRFMLDCERWWGQKITTISSDKYNDIHEVWRKHLSMNVAHGAVCSSELKRKVRERFQKGKDYAYQVFGFDIDESKRAKSMTLNYGEINPIYPLLFFGYSKKKCIQIINEAEIEIPRVYKYGFHNNNCFKTGCVQGGIGYWQKMQREFPDKFDKMADLEHELTDKKGAPVTMLKDQSKEGGLVFLKPHPMYPLHKDISMMKGVHPEPLVECNGFCGTNDLVNKK